MEVSGSQRIPAPRDAVWASLTDPETLKACMPGCERAERQADGSFSGTVAVKVGPVNATFEGSARPSDAEPPQRCIVYVEGDGGPAGLGKGHVDLSLKEDGGETIVDFAVRAALDGKIAQLGSRLVDGVARQTAQGFFTRLAERAADGRLVAPPLAEAPPLVHEEPADGAAPIVDAPPLAAGAALAQKPGSIAPTSAPDVPDKLAPLDAGAPLQSPGGTAATRALLVVAIVVVVAVGLYFALWPAPPA